MNSSRAALSVILSTLLGGCPASAEPGDAGTQDSSRIDAPSIGEDAPFDPSLDAFRAAEFDAGGLVPDASPADAFVPPHDTGPADAFVTPESCSSEGMFRRVPCECGGMQSERCTSGLWEIASPCDGTRTCTPGAYETREYVACRVDQRTCGEDCSWGEWLTVVPGGECGGDDLYLCTSRANCDCQPDCHCEPIPGCATPVGVH